MPINYNPPQPTKCTTMVKQISKEQNSSHVLYEPKGKMHNRIPLTENKSFPHRTTSEKEINKKLLKHKITCQHPNS